MGRMRGQVTGLAVSDRHPYMFSCGLDKMVKCWDLEYNKVCCALEPWNGCMRAAAKQPRVLLSVPYAHGLILATFSESCAAGGRSSGTTTGTGAAATRSRCTPSWTCS